MALSSKLAKLDAYLDELGIIREDFLSDPRRPLIFRIGSAEYVLRDETTFFEAQLKAAAHYARAGIPEHRMPHGPSFRPELLLEGKAAEKVA